MPESPVDIFDVALPVTETSFIVAYGPCGLPYIRQIPETAYTVAVNGAIKYGLRYDLWACTSPDAPGVNPDWWQLGLDSPVPKLMDRRMKYNADYDCRQYAYGGAPGHLGERYLVAGGSTVGIITDLLVKQGCKHVVYCGCDMTGNAHADGSVCEWQYRGEWVTGDIWAKRRCCLTQMINRYTDMGVTIETISPSALEIPTWHH